MIFPGISMEMGIPGNLWKFPTTVYHFQEIPLLSGHVRESKASLSQLFSFSKFYFFDAVVAASSQSYL